MRGGQVDVDLALQLMLFSYCKIFNINPHDAKDTPMRTIIDMININGEVEKIKVEELEKAKQRG